MPTAMKLSIAASALALAAGISACAGKGSTDTAKQADFARDLQLASSTVDLAAHKVDPSLLTLENKPQGAPMQAAVVKKAPSGNRAVRSKAPTVKAAPVTEVAAADENEEQVDVLAEAPAPDISEPVAVAPRPSPIPVVTTSGDGSGDYGTSGNGGGIFGPGSGRGGVVIRGGGVGGDHCEIHGGMSRPRSTGGVLVPNRGGIVFGGGGGGGGIGTRSRGPTGSIGARGGVASPGGMGRRGR